MPLFVSKEERDGLGKRSLPGRDAKGRSWWVPLRSGIRSQRLLIHLFSVNNFQNGGTGSQRIQESERRMSSAEEDECLAPLLLSAPHHALEEAQWIPTLSTALLQPFLCVCSCDSSSVFSLAITRRVHVLALVDPCELLCCCGGA